MEFIRLEPLIMKIKAKDNLTIQGHFRIKTFLAGTKKLLRETDRMPNLIVCGENHGLYIVLNRLIGIETYSLAISTAKIGYGTSTPTVADTDLEIVAADNLFLAQKQRIANDEVKLIFFIPDADLPTSGTPYTEFGIFCGNQLFARSLISPSYSKSAGEDTEIDYLITATPTSA